MKTKEFNLSEKRTNHPYEEGDGTCYLEEDVKEFIKRREEVIQAFLRQEINCARMWIELNKLAGDKLIEGKE